MRVTYRHEHIKEYWARRWQAIPADEPMENIGAYPLKYAELTIQSRNGPILEAGCGAGRLLRFYKQRGYDIIGMDYIDDAVAKLKVADPELRVETGDITQLRYPDCSFSYVLAFGLYHNLEQGLDLAVQETCRVLKPGGWLCASFRADNLQTRLTDWLAEHRARNKGVAAAPARFHKLNLTKAEFRHLLERHGFVIDQVFPVENMPLPYKFSCCRSRGHKIFNEAKARTEGYRLSRLGSVVQKLLITCLPYQICNVIVIIARRPA